MSDDSLSISAQIPTSIEGSSFAVAGKLLDNGAV